METLISLLPFLLVVALIVGAGMFFWRQSKTKSRWGLGPMFGVKCPKCGTAMPVVRKPTSVQQFLWGGWTCPKCGTNIDKYGRERGSPQA